MDITTTPRPMQIEFTRQADKRYNAYALRQTLRKQGIRAQIPKRVWKTKKTGAGQSKKVSDHRVNSFKINELIS